MGAVEGEKLYQLGMFGMLCFISFQVYELNARNASLGTLLTQVEKRVEVIEQNVLTHLINHNEPETSIPVGLPLIKLPERRNQLRVEHIQ